MANFRSIMQTDEENRAPKVKLIKETGPHQTLEGKLEAIDMVKRGRSVKDVAKHFKTTTVNISNWVRNANKILGRHRVMVSKQETEDMLRLSSDVTKYGDTSMSRDMYGINGADKMEINDNVVYPPQDVGLYHPLVAPEVTSQVDQQCVPRELHYEQSTVEDTINRSEMCQFKEDILMRNKKTLEELRTASVGECPEDVVMECDEEDTSGSDEEYYKKLLGQSARAMSTFSDFLIVEKCHKQFYLEEYQRLNAIYLRHINNLKVLMSVSDLIKSEQDSVEAQECVRQMGVLKVLLGSRYFGNLKTRLNELRMILCIE